MQFIYTHRCVKQMSVKKTLSVILDKRDNKTIDYSYYILTQFTNSSKKPIIFYLLMNIL